MRISNDERKRWLRHLLPLPKEISIKGKVLIQQKNITIRLLRGTGKIGTHTYKQLQSVIGQKSKSPKTDKNFEILIGLIDTKGLVGGVKLKNAERLKNLRFSEQAYIIESIHDNKLVLGALTPKGLFYATQTLISLITSTHTKAKITIPIISVVDWPDFEERGLLNFGPTEEKLRWMTSMKMNWGHMDGVHPDMVIKEKPGTVKINSKLMNFGRKLGFNLVPFISHLNFIGTSAGLFKAYPETAGKGDQAIAGKYKAHQIWPGDQHRAPNPASPILIRYLTDWMKDIFKQGGTEISCWLTEQPAEDQRKETTALGQFVLEARAFLKAWQQAKNECPEMKIRLFLSTTTLERDHIILDEAPPEVLIERCCFMNVERITCEPRDLVRNPLYDHYAAQGRRILTVDIPVTANGRLETPEMKLPQRSAHRIRHFMKEFHDRKYSGAGGMLAWDTFSKEMCDFSISALAEWAWNVNGRSEKEFAITWATRQGYNNPEAVGEWSQLMGPVEFDVYDSGFPMAYTWGCAVEMIKKHRRPVLGEGMFRYYRNPRSFNRKIETCDKALMLAKKIDQDFTNETLVISSYVQMTKTIYHIAELISTSELDNHKDQARLANLLDQLKNDGKENQKAIRTWRTHYGQEPWHHRLYRALAATEETVEGIVNHLSERFFYLL